MLKVSGSYSNTSVGMICQDLQRRYAFDFGLDLKQPITKEIAYLPVKEVTLDRVPCDKVLDVLLYEAAHPRPRPMSREDRQEFAKLACLIPAEEYPHDAWIREVGDGTERLLETADALEEQRDALLAACEQAKSVYWQLIEHLPPEKLREIAEPLWDSLTKAIAKAKGK